MKEDTKNMNILLKKMKHDLDMLISDWDLFLDDKEMDIDPEDPEEWKNN
jgi:hypothetical protein